MGYSVTLRIQAPVLLHFLPIIPHLSRYRLLLLLDLLPYPPTSFHYFTFRVAYAPLLSPLSIRLLYSSSLLFIFCSTLYLVECRSDIYPDFPRIALWFISLRVLFFLLRDVGREYNDCMNFFFDRCVLIESVAAAAVDGRVRW
ncbi:hypothetical protein BJX62DRAFT_20317 [Aspergillus germanicus]